MAINEVHTFNAAMVNEFRAGYTRVQSLGAVTLDTTGVFGTTGNSIFGIPGAQAFAGFSAMSEGTPPSPSGIASSGNGTEYAGVGNANTGTNFTDNTFQYGDNFTWLKGQSTPSRSVLTLSNASSKTTFTLVTMVPSEASTSWAPLPPPPMQIRMDMLTALATASPIPS